MLISQPREGEFINFVSLKFNVVKEKVNFKHFTNILAVHL